MHIIFESNIDFYRDKYFPKQIDFRPNVGDQVPFEDQEREFRKYPILEITNVKYIVDSRGNVIGFHCWLYFNKNAHKDICEKILNHQDL